MTAHACLTLCIPCVFSVIQFNLCFLRYPGYFVFASLFSLICAFSVIQITLCLLRYPFYFVFTPLSKLLCVCSLSSLLCVCTVIQCTLCVLRYPVYFVFAPSSRFTLETDSLPCVFSVIQSSRTASSMWTDPGKGSKSASAARNRANLTCSETPTLNEEPG